MLEVGEALHVAGSGRIIVRLTGGGVDEGSTLYSRSGAKMAEVREIIGPISRPYASASPLTNNTRRISGRKLFSDRRRSA